MTCYLTQGRYSSSAERTAGNAVRLRSGAQTALVLELIPIVLKVASSIVLSMALGHYDIRAFILQKELEKGISERDALFQELQHRVKNSLTMVSSLLSLDEQRLEDDRSKEILMQAQGKIRTMSAVYERLYRSEEHDTVEFSLFTADIIDMLLGANAVDTGRIRVERALEPIRIDLKRAIPLGLIMNELLTNAIKHAFPGGRSGTISISLRREGPRVALRVTDDGIGTPALASPADTDGYGMKLVGLLCRQAGGELRYANDPGTAVEIAFDHVPACPKS